MLEYLVDRSVRHRWLVLLAVAALAAFGVFNYQRLPIDAMPDITNVQVQINTEAPGFSPLEAEQRITFADRDGDGRPAAARLHALALALRPLASHGRVRGRHGHLLRAPARRRAAARSARRSCRRASSPSSGPIATGLGEIFMFILSVAPGATRPDGTPWTPTRPAHGHGLGRAAAAAHVPGRHRGQHDRRLRAAVRRRAATRPRCSRSASRSPTSPTALERNNVNVGAGYIERFGSQYLVRVPGQVADARRHSRDPRRDARRHADRRSATSPRSAIGKELRTGAATHERRGGRARHGVHADGREQPHRRARRGRQARRDQRSRCRTGLRLEAVYDRTTLVDRTIATVRTNLLEGALLVIAVLFVLLGNLRAALVTTLVIPLSMLLTITGMVEARVSGNLMSLGALDFGLIVDGAVIIVENCLRRLGDGAGAAAAALPLARAPRASCARRPPRSSGRACSACSSSWSSICRSSR